MTNELFEALESVQDGNLDVYYGDKVEGPITILLDKGWIRLKEDTLTGVQYAELTSKGLLELNCWRLSRTRKGETPQEPEADRLLSCPACGGTGQDDPPPGKYHGKCPKCGGTGKQS